ncbi:MAG: hypothetical protein KDB86_01305 [Actinobacteria bacterium]|nr:hypothetical protein [Actinomycetota bacterium]MCB9390395.1 hypothetical protein [Acidimicrobiia bacterium]
MPVELLIQGDGQGAMSTSDPKTWKGVEKGDRVWIRLTAPSPDEIKHFAAFADAPPAGVELLSERRSLPRYVASHGWLYLALQVLSFETTADDHVEVSMFVNGNVMVSVESRKSPLVDQAVRWAARGDTAAIEHVDELAGRLSIIFGRRYLAIADELNRRSDDLYERALITRRGVLNDIQVQRRVTGIVHTKVRRQRFVIENLLEEDPPVCSDAALRLFERGRDVHSEVIDSLSAAHSVLADALDTYRGAATDRQSTATTILAVYSAVLLPLTLIAGWYGMNVQLPGQGASDGWILITIAMAIIAMVSMGVFVRAGFVRVPGRRVHRQTQSDFLRSVAGSIPQNHPDGPAGTKTVPVNDHIQAESPHETTAH